MPRSKYWLTCGALCLLISACAEPVVTPVGEDPAAVEADAGAETTREITLTSGDTLSVGVSTEGDADITVTILDGKPDAGVYTTKDKALLEIAHDASNVLSDTNSTVSVDVNEAGEIVAISHSMVLGGDGE